MSVLMATSVVQAVESFWHRAGEVEPFPRVLERPLALALPVALVKLHDLDLHHVEHYLDDRGIAFRFGCDNRRLHGCLLCFAGRGFLFLAATDQPDEQRYTIAHEIGHFMLDYLQPREQAVSAFGPAVIQLLDGHRRPSVDERIHALLRRIPIGVHVGLIDRAGGARDTVHEKECRADDFARALLAPEDVVMRGVRHAGEHRAAAPARLAARLRSKFGLPAHAANTYARQLLRSIGATPRWIDSINWR
jgi:Zn-dependent peptidase ImmA (M78 family)